MRQIRRMQKRLAALASSERGVAIEMVLVVMVVGLGFSAVAINAAISSQSGTTRDQARKDALAIADAGAQRALYTYNKITTEAPTPCVVKTGSGGAATLTEGGISASTNPFCAPVGGSADSDAMVGNGYFTYWVHPCTNQMQAGACNFTAGQTRVIKIVSEGCSNTSPTCAGGIARRVAITASGVPGSLATGSAKAIGLDGISMEGWTEMEVPAATNKTFVMRAQGGCPGDTQGHAGCPRICPGDWKYPVEVSVGPDPNDLIEAPGTQRCTPGRNNPPGPPESDAVVIKRTITLAPVDIGTAKTQNDNGRLGNCTTNWTNQAAYNAAIAWNADPAHSLPSQKVPVPTPVYASQPGCTLNAPGSTPPVNNGPNKDTSIAPGTISWDPATRTLTMNGTGDAQHRLTLQLLGRNYLFCKVQLTGWSDLQVANTTAMPGTNNVASKLFFDSPENCPGNPTTQITVKDGSNIDSLNWNAFNKPSPGVLPLIAMVGSSSKSTTAEFRTGIWFFANKAMLYAPRTDIVLDTWARENEGWYAGKTIAMKSGAEIESPPTLDPVGVGIAPSDFILFHQDTYVECGPPGSTIDANC